MHQQPRFTQAKAAPDAWQPGQGRRQAKYALPSWASAAKRATPPRLSTRGQGGERAAMSVAIELDHHNGLDLCPKGDAVAKARLDSQKHAQYIKEQMDCLRNDKQYIHDSLNLVRLPARALGQHLGAGGAAWQCFAQAAFSPFGKLRAPLRSSFSASATERSCPRCSHPLRAWTPGRLTSRRTPSKNCEQTARACANIAFACAAPLAGCARPRALAFPLFDHITGSTRTRPSARGRRPLWISSGPASCCSAC